MSTATATGIDTAVEGTRSAVGLFRLGHMDVIDVKGDDRVTWLNGMVSNDVAVLEPGRERSGCHAALLTHRGAIIADLHVLVREDRFSMLVERSAAESTIQALDRFIVADDVELERVGDAIVQWSLEGPRAPDVLAALGVDPELAPYAAIEAEIAGQVVWLAAAGLSGEWARRILAPAADSEAVEAAIVEAGSAFELVVGDDAALEVLRIEAGIPRQGLELDEDVLPDEAQLDSAISTTKGCYVGQEIVARLRSRGQVNHLLVGLRFDAAPPEPGAVLSVGGKRTGEITSVARSPSAGAIALGFVRREHSDPGTAVEVDGVGATVSALPFAGRAASS